MTQPASKKQGIKKCRSATFSIDGFSFTIGKTGSSRQASINERTDCVCGRVGQERESAE